MCALQNVSSATLCIDPAKTGSRAAVFNGTNDRVARVDAAATASASTFAAQSAGRWVLFASDPAPAVPEVLWCALLWWRCCQCDRDGVGVRLCRPGRRQVGTITALARSACSRGILFVLEFLTAAPDAATSASASTFAAQIAGRWGLLLPLRVAPAAPRDLCMHVCNNARRRGCHDFAPQTRNPKPRVAGKVQTPREPAPAVHQPFLLCTVSVAPVNAAVTIFRSSDRRVVLSFLGCSALAAIVMHFCALDGRSHLIENSSEALQTPLPPGVPIGGCQPHSSGTSSRLRKLHAYENFRKMPPPCICTS